MKMLLAIAALSFGVGAQAQSSEKDALDAVEEAVAAAAQAAAGAAESASDAAIGEEMGVTDAYVGAFDPSRDAMADIDAALAAARTSGKHVLLILGGDWCHDSEALVQAMASPRTEAMLAARYEIVRVHVPFSRSERVLPVAQRFGIDSVEGTPTVLILRPDGTPVNLEDAPRWRNSASRKPAAIHRALERAAPAIAP